MQSYHRVVALAAIFLFSTIAVADDDGPSFEEGAQRLMDDYDDDAIISVDEDTGYAKFVRLPTQGTQVRRSLANVRGTTPSERSMAFFRRYGEAFGVEKADSELTAIRTTRTATGGEHTVLRQTYGDIPVFGGELRTHFDASGQLSAVNGTFVSHIKVNLQPAMTPDQAVDVAIARVLTGNPAEASLSSAAVPDREQRFAAGSLATDLSAFSTTLMVFREGLAKGVPGNDHLAYEVEVRNTDVTVREFVYVDAHSGRVIDQITGIHGNLHRKVSEVTLANVVWNEGDPFPTGNSSWDDEINGAGETYYLFASMSGGSYLSFDGAGAEMLTVNNAASVPCPNATWNGVSTNYCTGVTADDTVAHEWAHAYTEYTNNLIYQWQPGALNEAYSDIWGEVVDFLNNRGTDSPDTLRSTGGCSIFGKGTPSVDNSYRWLSGEDDPAFGGAIRDMWDPTCYGDPGKVSDNEYWCSTADFGGVHTNSGVGNHAFALMVDGGSYNGQTIAGIGLTKASHIHWVAQNMLTPVSDFSDMADALEAACDSLIGIDLPALSTSAVNAGLSGEIITAANCATVAQINTAVEYRTPPSQCGFESLLQANAPALCEAQGNVETIALEDFEAGVVPAGWTVSSHDVVNPATFDAPNWDVLGNLPSGAGGSFAAFGANPNLGDCSTDIESGAIALDSPVIVLPAGKVPHVAFDHYVATEAAWDGANLKISVNGAPYTIVPSTAYTFNPYNGAINTNSTNPLGGEEAFTGANEGELKGSWGQSQINLYGLAFPGDSIQLRFDLGMDGCNGWDGWYVDSVHTYSCSAEPLPICGNGEVELGEMCDDGNAADGDGCSSSCAVESGWACSHSPATNSMNVVADWSFEGGVPNADWAASSTFTGIPGFPLCGPDNGCPVSLTTTGEWSVWVGGLSAGVTSSVEQTVTIPTTATDLTVEILRGLCDDPSDTLHVRLDGTDIGTLACDAEDSDYVTRTFSVAGFNDGGAHTLFIGGSVGGTNGTHTNFFVDDVAIEDHVFRPATPSVCRIVPSEVSCNAEPVGFDVGIPDVWTVVDNIGSPVVWSNILGSDEPGNYTGGDGDAATASSDRAGVAAFDTELRSNVFSLANATSASVEYLVNYQNYFGFDNLDLDISTDGGSTWTTLLSWNEDHPPGGLRNAPGESISVDLSAYLGESNLVLSWRYYDQFFLAWDWYAQVDDIGMSCDLLGRMVGEGEFDSANGEEVEHEFHLDCQDAAVNNSLELEWELDDDNGGDDVEHEFRLTSLTQALCSDRPGLDEGQPNVGFDTFIGAGEGLLDGEPATITFRLTDAGEPGTSDSAEFTIVGSNGTTTLSGTLEDDNHQALPPATGDDDDEYDD